jgi:hypothetical protein
LQEHIVVDNRVQALGGSVLNGEKSGDTQKNRRHLHMQNQNYIFLKINMRKFKRGDTSQKTKHKGQAAKTIPVQKRSDMQKK